MISTRGRYALRVMLDLAENQAGSFVPMKEVAERQDISLKYIERIMPSLVQAGYVEGLQGKGGGYRLVREPAAYTVGDILRCTDEDLAPVACLSAKAKTCDRAEYCKTLPMWTRLNGMLSDFFDGITLKDLLEPAS